MRILLVRHGLTDKTGPVLAGRTPGVHLNATGEAQARDLAERLAGVPLTAVFSSPMERCRETAGPLARAASLRVRTDRRLVEVGYGAWTMQPLPKLAKTSLWRAVQYRPTLAAFPDGESLLAAQQRIVGAIEDLRRAHEGNVVCCSHADMIKLAVAHYGGVHVDLYQRIVIAPVSLTVLRFGDFGVQVERMNDTGGVADLAGGTGTKRRSSAAAKEWGHQ